MEFIHEHYLSRKKRLVQEEKLREKKLLQCIDGVYTKEQHFDPYFYGLKVNPSPTSGPLRSYYQNLICSRDKLARSGGNKEALKELELHMAKTLRLLYFDVLQKKLVKSAKKYIEAGYNSPRGKYIFEQRQGREFGLGKSSRKSIKTFAIGARAHSEGERYEHSVSDDFLRFTLILDEGLFRLNGWYYLDAWLPKNELRVFENDTTPDSRKIQQTQGFINEL